MTLNSSRFKSSSTLVKIEAQQIGALKKGASGRAVHLVQMALLDLGYAMPRSTGNANYSPDGIYGDETAEVVGKFQRDSLTLKVDAVVGQKTLQELDRRFSNPSHRVTLHFRSIALTNVPFQRSLSNTEIVFGQYGIQIAFGSGESILLSPDKHERFKRIDQECDWNLSSGELDELIRLGSPAPLIDVLVFHVNTFADSNVLGCGGHAKDRAACTVAASALAWDTAHEVGHALLGSSFSPVHVEDSRNLMFPTSRTTPAIPVLTDRQVAQMKLSACCRAI